MKVSSVWYQLDFRIRPGFWDRLRFKKLVDCNTPQQWIGKLRRQGLWRHWQELLLLQRVVVHPRRMTEHVWHPSFNKSCLQKSCDQVLYMLCFAVSHCPEVQKHWINCNRQQPDFSCERVEIRAALRLKMLNPTCRLMASDWLSILLLKKSSRAIQIQH